MDMDKEDWSALPQKLYVARDDGYFTFDLTKQVRVRDADDGLRTEFIGRHSGDNHIETFSLSSLLQESIDLYDDEASCKRRVEKLVEREQKRLAAQEEYERTRAARRAANSAKEEAAAVDF